MKKIDSAPVRNMPVDNTSDGSASIRSTSVDGVFIDSDSVSVNADSAPINTNTPTDAPFNDFANTLMNAPIDTFVNTPTDTPINNLPPVNDLDKDDPIAILNQIKLAIVKMQKASLRMRDILESSPSLGIQGISIESIDQDISDIESLSTAIDNLGSIQLELNAHKALEVSSQLYISEANKGPDKNITKDSNDNSKVNDPSMHIYRMKDQMDSDNND